MVLHLVYIVETLVAGVGLMVSSTGSSQTYNYQQILGKEDDITT